MSERGSFITEFIYCDKCFEKMKKVLCIGDKYLNGQKLRNKPIIAGKLGGIGPSHDVTMFKYKLFNKENAPCHPTKIALIPDTANPEIMIVLPNGDVENYNEYQDDISEQQKIGKKEVEDE